MRVCLGGTFNILHKGHIQLLETAIQTAGKNGYVFIGVSDGALLQKKTFIKPLKERITAIQNYFISKGYPQTIEILPIYDKYGLAVDSDFDAIIVSSETRKNAEAINKKRITLAKNPLKIIEIPMVLAEDNIPISSTRIQSKIINENGKILHKT
jgi:pantetheine-phosphate adenylyltransferase